MKSDGLWFYRWMSRFGILNYRAKIMVTAFIGTHVPLLALVSWFAFQSAPDWQTFISTVGVTLVATLGGTAVTLFVLHELLRPVVRTGFALRRYREAREIVDLPADHLDEVGRLMADAHETISHLELVRDILETIDEDSGLPNRRKFLELSATRVEAGQAFAIALIRFGNLGRIAGTLDQRQAAACAREMAERLVSHFPPGTVIARVSESEFALLLERDGDTESAWIALSRRLYDTAGACSGDIALPELTVRPALYCGLASHPEDGATAEALLDHAASAAAQASESMPVMLYSAESRDKALDRFRLEQDLRSAIGNGELALYYQPIIDLDAGRFTGGEALLRWNHPSQGLVAPDRFIPIAEESGLIEPIGLWVMREACRQLREWEDRGIGPDLRIAINLSARQFLDPHLKNHVAEAIADAGIRPGQLEIELTETAVMADHVFSSGVFSTLRDLGVGIAIDDFGTGYATMSYLRKLPFDKLKIDREFVTDVDKLADAQAICRALIELAHGLRLKVLAEGTETEAEVRYLKEHGCSLFQGYFFSRPLPAEQFELALDDREIASRMHQAAPPSAGRRAAG